MLLNDVAYLSRLRDRLQQKCEPEPMTGCWLWTASLNKHGYGMIGVILESGKQVKRGCHRISYELFKGPIPDGLQIDHLCRQRCCQNPDHLEAVTGGENQLRGLKGRLKPRPTHCPRGHEYDEKNSRPVIVKGCLSKACLACAREKYHERKSPLVKSRAYRYPQGTHCPHGHEFTPENSRESKNESKTKICRKCQRDKAREKHRAKMALRNQNASVK